MEKKEKKTEKEKMLNEELYYSDDDQLHKELLLSKELCFDYNNLRPSEVENNYLKKLVKIWQ